MNAVVKLEAALIPVSLDDPPASAQSPDAAVVRCMNDVQPTPISWLWPGRIARGKVTLIAGDPGLGKSQLTAALAACVSVGGRWPVDRAACPAGNVLILNAEDDAADTIRPRLDAAEANVRRIHVVDAIRVPSEDGKISERGFDLSRDIDALSRAARQIGDVALITIDPISAYLGGTDSHRNADIRGLLAPLSAMASELGAAIVAVSHLNKSSGGDAMMRVTGSLAFVAAARAAFVVVKDADDPARRLFIAAKNNLGPDQGTGLAFRVQPVTLDSGINTSRLEWESEPVTMSANEAMAAASDDPDERSMVSDATEAMFSVLSCGSMPAREAEAALKGAGFSPATIRRARKAAGVVVDKASFSGGWRWSLPPKMLNGAEDAQQESLSTFEEFEHLRANGHSAPARLDLERPS